MSESITRFYIGQAIVIFVALVAGCFEIAKTNKELHHLSMEERQNHASAALKDLADAVSKVSEQLKIHADMFNDLAICFDGKAQKSECWHRNFMFNPSEADQAWDRLEIGLDAAAPYLSSAQESKGRAVLETRELYVQAVRSHFPPENQSDADDIRRAIERASVQLRTNFATFRDVVVRGSAD